MQKLLQILYLISRALLLYYQGHSQEDISLRLKTKHRTIIPRRTIGNWISKYKNICTFYPLRKTALTRFPPTQLIDCYTLEHRQIYIFKKHTGKLHMLLPTLDTIAAQNLSSYLADIMSPAYPHYLFHPDKDQDSQTNRSSQLKFQTLPFMGYGNDSSKIGPFTELVISTGTFASRENDIFRRGRIEGEQGVKLFAKWHN